MANNGIVERVSRITRDIDYAAQLTSMITELGLEDGAARDMFKTIDLQTMDANINYFNMMAELAKYEGFNPREMLAILHNSYKMYCARLEADPTLLEEYEAEIKINGVLNQFIYTNNESFERDMQYLSLIFITRRAMFSKIKDKSHEVFKKILEMLKVKYDINTQKRQAGRSLGSKVVTIPRIAASVPWTTVNYYHLGLGRFVVDITGLFTIELPRVIFAPMVASLPIQADAPLAIILSMAVKTDDVLHRSEPKTPLKALHQYMMAFYNSSANTDGMRRKCALKWNLGRLENNMFLYNVRFPQVKEEAKAIIRASRPADPDVEQILTVQ